MKQFEKWKTLAICLFAAICVYILFLFFMEQYGHGVITILCGVSFLAVFFGLWNNIKRHGVQTEVDITRVLGKDAKDALSFGNVGILTYDENYVVTWASPFFKERNIDLVNHKLTSWIESIRSLFDDDVDVIVGKENDHIYEITRKQDASIIYVREITDYYHLRQDYVQNEVVIGLMQLDNYMEYQSYENEEIITTINSHLRTPLVTWAKKNGMLIRRLRSDRFMLVLNQQILQKVKSENFSILQVIKDEANSLDVSITLSMAFAYGTNHFITLDNMVNELIELAQSRGGDQVALRAASGTVQFIGGNSETSSTRSKVRVRIMAQSISEAIEESQRVFVAGHIMSDYDCMGAALSLSSWAHALNKEVYIVLKDVSRDAQLQETMDHYARTINERHRFITPEQAASMIEPDKDLLLMVDHGIPAISSAKAFIDRCTRIVVIDHHRRNESFVKQAMLTYVESTASSSCELIVELLNSIPNHIPVFEMEATIMYLGILVDTNRFKMHTDARTFEATALLRTWGANATVAEKALCENYEHFTLKNAVIQKAVPVMDHYMISCIEDKGLEKTLMAQVAQELLLIKGCQASFTIAPLANNPKVSAISARSDGSINVQKIMEHLRGGGHFSAAAVERDDLSPRELKEELIRVIKEEYNQ